MRQTVPLVLMAFLSCKDKMSEAQSGGTPPRVAEAAQKVEMEFKGTWESGGVNVKSVDFVVQSADCGAAKTQVFGSKTLAEPGAFFAEFFVPSGSQAFVCLYGKTESGEIGAKAAYSGNPVRVTGTEEIYVKDIALTLQLQN
jgi:hypothetical protein